MPSRALDGHLADHDSFEARTRCRLCELGLDPCAKWIYKLRPCAGLTRQVSNMTHFDEPAFASARRWSALEFLTLMDA